MTDKDYTKKCSLCKKVKPASEFGKRGAMTDGLKSRCNQCLSDKSITEMRTRKGLVTKIYCKQRTSSKVRNHPEPEYSLEELRIWIFGRENFNSLYFNWCQSGYDKKLTPSVDRLDDYLPYTLDNIRLVTWHENDKKGTSDIINGVNNKQSKSVIQLTRDGGFINQYYSLSNAYRETGISIGNISECCSGSRNHAGGFVWKLV